MNIFYKFWAFIKRLFPFMNRAQRRKEAHQLRRKGSKTLADLLMTYRRNISRGRACGWWDRARRLQKGLKRG